MADKEVKAPESTVDADREYELNKQALVRAAVEGVTRDKNGNPIAVVVNAKERPDGSLRE